MPQGRPYHACSMARHITARRSARSNTPCSMWLHACLQRNTPGASCAPTARHGYNVLQLADNGAAHPIGVWPYAFILAHPVVLNQCYDMVPGGPVSWHLMRVAPRRVDEHRDRRLATHTRARPAHCGPSHGAAFSASRCCRRAHRRMRARESYGRARRSAPAQADVHGWGHRQVMVQPGWPMAQWPDCYLHLLLRLGELGHVGHILGLELGLLAVLDLLVHRLRGTHGRPRKHSRPCRLKKRADRVPRVPVAHSVHRCSVVRTSTATTH